MRATAAVAVSLALAAPVVLAEKLPNEFRAAFEKVCRPKRSFAVVVQKGVPTTSIYGVEGKSTDAHYSIDVVDGEWKTSEGLLDFDQTAADFLDLGEVMELDSISYKDNRVDLRMVSIESKKVTRGSGWSKSTKREPVATNFKFFLPFPKPQVVLASDMPTVQEYIGAYLRFFPNEEEARRYAAQVVSAGGVPPAAPAVKPAQRSAPAAAAPAAKPAGGKKEIKPGMTALEVMEILGKPDKEVSFGNQIQWTYPDLKVIFEGGRVKDVRF
jgi:hypothetical protein